MSAFARAKAKSFQQKAAAFLLADQEATTLASNFDTSILSAYSRTISSTFWSTLCTQHFSLAFQRSGILISNPLY